jgi:hypothetical protein
MGRTSTWGAAKLEGAWLCGSAHRSVCCEGATDEGGGRKTHRKNYVSAPYEYALLPCGRTSAKKLKCVRRKKMRSQEKLVAELWENFTKMAIQIYSSKLLSFPNIFFKYDKSRGC